MNTAQCSVQMAKVRSQGNQSTEGQAELVLTKVGIQGWAKALQRQYTSLRTKGQPRLGSSSSSRRQKRRPPL
jgi:hypothetical protein